MDQPQYTALIHRWDVNPKLSDDLFQFQPPEGVRKVDFLNRHAEPQPLKKADRQVTRRSAAVVATIDFFR